MVGTYLLDIPVRFEFEKALYEERGNGELSVSQLKALMTGKQREVLGDVLLDGEEDPWFWASKLHFYITGVTFYNFPYTFGYLFEPGGSMPCSGRRARTSCPVTRASCG